MSQSRYIYGIHAVKSLLEHQHDSIQEVFFVTGKRNKRVTTLTELAKKYKVAIKTCSQKELDNYSEGGNHQGVIAVLAAGKGQERRSLIELVKHLPDPPLLLILDGLQDPHNLGACLRTADAMGVDAVVFPKDKAVGVTATVRKVACGAAETVPFFQVTNLARTIDQLKDLGIWIMGAAGEAATEISKADFTVATALVMGAEGKGMRRLTRDKCDILFNIPMVGSVESYNVSVAAGIALYEAVRQRGVTE